MKDRIAYLILRAGLGLVFLIFGIGKFKGDIWASTIEGIAFFQNLPWDVRTSVYLIGALEVLTGTGLLTGLFTRFFATIASLQLIAILILLRFQEIRDIGLLGAAIYLMLVNNNAGKSDTAGLPYE